ncbi:D-serine ammonia-lyase [Lagierella sp.]|uniref:D-serine ammonia-lyase n=1 Tax=Lagierella sp. TaxID=2849657 RepID=UPI002611FAF8|nr:D-serine ammonia-lyase [Lagierella sp.]
MDYLDRLKKGEEFFWENKSIKKSDASTMNLNKEVDFSLVLEAEKRLERFAPFIMKEFPKTYTTNGIIESELTKIPAMKKRLREKYCSSISGELYIKEDNNLAVAGSIKARGGIYEILKYTEELLIDNNLLDTKMNYESISSDTIKKFLSQYTIQVGSTGNLGLSIGIISAVLGYKVIVHMSRDAADWKKKLLRSYGILVVEYEGDYGKAVEKGRKMSQENPFSYFVDDENSKNLFYGYAVAALRLKKQLKEKQIEVNSKNPLFVYIPCGVGGAPGGVAYGLKEVFRENVHIFFVEPTGAPCMLLGMATGKHSEICVQDIGLDGITLADGLAVGRPSGFVGKIMEDVLSGIFTIEDKYLFEYMRDLLETEKIFIEPSAASCFQGVGRLYDVEEFQRYLKNIEGLQEENISHIVWSTGGSLVPEALKKEYIDKVL